MTRIPGGACLAYKKTPVGNENAIALLLSKQGTITLILLLLCTGITNNTSACTIPVTGGFLFHRNRRAAGSGEVYPDTSTHTKSLRPLLNSIDRT